MSIRAYYHIQRHCTEVSSCWCPYRIPQQHTLGCAMCCAWLSSSSWMCLTQVCYPGHQLFSPSLPCGVILGKWGAAMPAPQWEAHRQRQLHCWRPNTLSSPGHHPQNAKLFDLSHCSLCRQHDDLSTNDSFVCLLQSCQSCCSPWVLYWQCY